MKRIVLCALAVVLLLGILFLFWPSEKADPGLVRYWQSQGLNKEEARYLALQGPERRDVPATEAAYNDSLPPPEETIGLLSGEGDDPGQQSEELLGLCKNCPRGEVDTNGVRAERHTVFWETNFSALVLSQYCYKKKRRSLFSELYLSEGRWVPRYLFQPLKNTSLRITRDGLRDLEEEEKNFRASCQASA